MVQIGNQVKYDKCGRMTCPLELATLLRLQKGIDELTWHIENGQVIVRKVTKLYNGQFDFERQEIEQRLLKYESELVGVIDNDGLTEDELKARAYELYKQDQNRKENGTKYR
ncbi:MAG: hypothetical protein ACOYIP_08650 [Coriobacteriales bacterium]|jgi:hypothetical protein